MDCGLLAGCQLFLWRVSERWTMAMNSVGVVEDRAGITFGVELYVPWDAPEAVVDISSAGVDASILHPFPSERNATVAYMFLVRPHGSPCD